MLGGKVLEGQDGEGLIGIAGPVGQFTGDTEDVAIGPGQRVGFPGDQSSQFRVVVGG